MTIAELETGLADLQRVELHAERARLRGSLHAFVQKFWHLVEPLHAFVDNWHIHAVCHELETVIMHPSASRRLVFNVPPGTSKSLVISVLFPCWVWARDARKRFLMASYGAHLTMRDNLRSRDVIESPEYRRLFGIELVDDQNTKTRYNTTKGGWRIASSVGGVGTGEHPNVIVIDDPTTAEQAKSDPERQAANEWFDSTMSTRGVSQNVIVIVVMQRLHDDDLTGHVLPRGGWNHVCFPMRYEAARPASDKDPGYVPDSRDARTVQGELLWPELFTEEKVRRMELDLGPVDAEAQLQQQPHKLSGKLFRPEWFNITTVRPKFDEMRRQVRGWDTGGTEGGGDWTAGVKLAELKDGRVFVLDVVHDQLGPDGVNRLFVATSMADGPLVAQREEKEGGSAGGAVILARARSLKGKDYAGVVISGDKTTRAKPFRAQVEAGNVFVMDAPWTEAYIRELCAFPVGKHDDQVDASSCAYNELIQAPEPVEIGSMEYGVVRDGDSPFSFGANS